ncbi:hypothetical protein [Marmoricola sp. RAF53]|uniref:hypothetical protein n=1 Tax=Marmoricola sp. RAF53 TaxID=3233059 RepID=UPI003F94BDE6
MKARTALLVTGLVIAGGALAPTTAADAKPIDKGHFHDVFTEFFDCDGTPVRADNDIKGNFLFNQRGSSPFPYYRESVRGTTVYTNLDNGGTFTTVFNGNTRDTKITDNGDGTITITSYASGGSHYKDTHGKLVLSDSGQTRFAVDIDYNGTPGDASDDVEVPDSFRIVRESNGTNDTAGRDFCDDVREFTSG